MICMQPEPRHFLNRELELLNFQERVLEQALDTSVPLLERMFFLLIVSSNLDEFFEIRVAGVIQKLSLSDDSGRPDRIIPSELLKQISERAHQLIHRQYEVLNQSLLPELKKQGITYLKRQEINKKQRAWMLDYFTHQVQPVLTPISLDPAHPFPKVVNKSLHFIVELEGKDAFGREINRAIVPAPRSLPRVIRVPDEVATSQDQFVMLSAVIHENIALLFPGMKPIGCHQFRVTRNADLQIDDDIDDLAKALEGELSSRRYGQAVRLEVTTNCPEHLYRYLLKQYDLTDNELYRVDGPVNMTRLITRFEGRPDLYFKPFEHAKLEEFDPRRSVFKILRERDLLIHHPFHSLEPFIHLLKKAASDPKVLAIKQTIYRSGEHSEVIEALCTAARGGKEVTAVVELRARFDEGPNIEIAARLQKAGAVVLYGVVGFKTHAKLCLIVRREKQGLKRYAHLGTGNYHPGNARAYTDYGLMTSNTQITSDVHSVFQELTGMGKEPVMSQILHAPFHLHQPLIELINQETKNAKAGLPARIIIKVNAITEEQLMRALIEASQAGVTVDLITRSICCLQPGVPGLSDNIRVRSIVGRFLEHTRVYFFANAGDPLIYLSSADWMDRNLFNRVETCFPILDPKLKQQVYQDGLLNYLRDNQQAWSLGASGKWQRVHASEDEADFGAQKYLLNTLCGS